MNRTRGEWFAQHILPHEPALRRWLGKFARDIDLDDVIQETYARIASCDYGAIKQPKAYMFTVAHNAVITLLRSRRVVRLVPLADMEVLSVLDLDPDPEESLMAREQLSLLRNAIAKLPDQCRRVMTLRKVEGLPQREVAQRLGLSESTVEKHVARGMQRCADHLTGKQDEEGAPQTARPITMVKP
jgi:RNA polymerase sigma-70 factor (ECF subfamily)